MSEVQRKLLDDAARTGVALVDQIDHNQDMAVEVVYSLTIDELRLTLLALVGAAARLRDELTRLQG